MRFGAAGAVLACVPARASPGLVPRQPPFVPAFRPRPRNVASPSVAFPPRTFFCIFSSPFSPFSFFVSTFSFIVPFRFRAACPNWNRVPGSLAAHHPLLSRPSPPRNEKSSQGIRPTSSHFCSGHTPDPPHDANQPRNCQARTLALLLPNHPEISDETVAYDRARQRIPQDQL